MKKIIFQSVIVLSLLLSLQACGSRSGGSDSAGSADTSTPSDNTPGTSIGPPANISLDNSLAANEVLPKGGTATITATVTDSSGNPVADGTLVKFTADKGTITTSSITANGSADATFQSGSTGGTVTITATAGTASQTSTLQVATGEATSIITKSVQPQTIGIKGSGIEDTSLITFEVRDAAGNPIEDGTLVTFNLATSINGGEQLSANSAETAGGLVTVALQGGTVPGTVAVRASVDADGNILTTEARVTIANNRPDAGHITMGATVLNLAGGVTLGLQSEINAYIGDRAGNVAPDGWPVSFISECGTIGSSDGFETSTSLGVATATFQTSAPSTPNLGGVTPTGNGGLCRIVAYTPGKGAFQDLNGNGVYDLDTDVCTTHLDEPYIDANDSKEYESGEYYVDVNGNDKFDTNVVDCIDDSMIWTSMNLLISDYAEPLTIQPSTFNLSLGESETFTLNLSDVHGNALVAGTTIKINADGGKIVGLSEYVMPDTVGTAAYPFTFALSSDQVPTDPEKSLPEPSFVTVTATLIPADGANNNGAGFFDVATGMINLPVPEPASLDIFVSSDIPAGSKLAQGETSEITALLRYSDGSEIPDGTEVLFTPSGGSVSPALATTVSGVATTTFTAPNIGGAVTIKAATEGIESTTTINISNGDASTIVVNSISPQQIGVRGSGLGDSTIITFDVMDQDGNVAPDGTEVSFALSSVTGGGEKLSAPTDTIFDGQVSVTLQSGVRAGTAAITASITLPDNSVVSTVARVIIAAGLPDSKHFSLSGSKRNLPGFTWFGETSDIKAYLADRYSNPVPEGTPIFFESEAGAMALTSVTTNALGQATATHVTQEPYPDTLSIASGLRGISKILAWTAGSEAFVDYNGNGVYDIGEPFEDIGEPFIDADDSDSYDEAPTVNDEERYVDVNGNNVYDPPNGIWDGETYIWTTIDILWSYSDQADIVFTLEGDGSSNPGCGLSPPEIPYGGACTFNLSVADKNGNPIMGGTTISLINTYNTIDDPQDTNYTISEGGFTIPDTTGPGPGITEFTFNVTNPKTTAGDYRTDFGVEVKGDKNLEKVSKMAIVLKGL